MSKKVLILCNYSGGFAAGQRFRFEQYVGILQDAGIEPTVAAFFPEWVWPIIHKPGNTLLKIWAVACGFGRRARSLAQIGRYDYVFIHLEAAPIGPPVIEWLLFALGKKVVYDIDDAIFISRTSAANRLASWLRFRSKVPYVTRKSWRITACNPFLVNWARQHNDDVVLVPTTVDPVYHRRTRTRQDADRPVIGWTGTRSNIGYLDIILPVLKELEKSYDFEFRVISDVTPPDPGLRHYSFVPWRRESEIHDLQSFDIGVMPVPDGPWEKGKVGFKAIQYGALEIVSVSSDVGSATEVVTHGQTGFLVPNDPVAWHDAIKWLLDHPESWRPIGAAAKDQIMAKYSVPSQAKTYVGLFAEGTHS